MLLHLTTPAAWRSALALGSVAPPSLVTDGFVHLSSPEQVHLPHDRVFAGRDDTLLLVVDEGRLDAEVRWEPGVPGDPESMRFPHLYGALPVAAVTSVVPYGWALPEPGDLAARAAAFDRSVSVRRAAAVVEVDGGVVVLDPRVPASWEHNTVWVDDLAAPWAAAADRFDVQRVVLPGPGPVPEGWFLHEQRLQVLSPPGGTADPGVRAVTSEVMHGLWGPSWRDSIDGIGDAAVEDLLRRETLADAHLRVVDLAVLDDAGVPVSSAQLRVDGATAELTAVMTAVGARGRGHSRAVVTTAVARAAAAGCDLVWLVAAADDWPRRWYERLGFVDVGARWEAQRST